jgi:hypothetical protein
LVSGVSALYLKIVWILPIAEPQWTYFLFRCEQVHFNTGNFSLYPRDCRRFQLKAGLRYAQFPFKTGFLVQGLLTYKGCAFKRFPVKFYSAGKREERKCIRKYPKLAELKVTDLHILQ